jgi:hypothetical protein
MSVTAAGASSARPQYGSIARTASDAAQAAALTVPRSTRAAASMLPRYTARNSAVGSVTSDAASTSPSPYSVISTSPAAAIAARKTAALALASWRAITTAPLT